MTDRAPIHDGRRAEFARYDCGCPRGHGSSPLPTCTDPTCMSMMLDDVRQERDRARDDLAAHLAKNAEPAAQRDRLRRALDRLLREFPRIHSDYATHKQQAALRVAICALDEIAP